MKNKRLPLCLTALVIFSLALSGCAGAASPSPTPDHGGCPVGYIYDDATLRCRTRVGSCAYPQYFDAAAGRCQDREGACAPGLVFDVNAGCRAPLTSTPGGPDCSEGYVSTDAGCVTLVGSCPEPQYYDARAGRCMERGGGCPEGYEFDVNVGVCETRLGDCEYPLYYNAGADACQETGGGCREGYVFTVNGGCLIPSTATPGGPGCPDGYIAYEDGCRTEVGRCLEPGHYDARAGRCREREGGCPEGYYWDVNVGVCKTLVGDCEYPSYYNGATGTCAERGGGCLLDWIFDVNGGCRPRLGCALGYCRAATSGVCQTGDGNCAYPSYYDTETESCRQRGTPCAEGLLFDASTGVCRLPEEIALTCGPATPTPTLSPTVPVCPPGTYYAPATNKCIEIKTLTPKPGGGGCGSYGSKDSCTSAGCKWDPGQMTCS